MSTSIPQDLSQLQAKQTREQQQKQQGAQGAQSTEKESLRSVLPIDERELQHAQKEHEGTDRKVADIGDYVGGFVNKKW